MAVPRRILVPEAVALRRLFPRPALVPRVARPLRLVQRPPPRPRQGARDVRPAVPVAAMCRRQRPRSHRAAWLPLRPRASGPSIRMWPGRPPASCLHRRPHSPAGSSLPEPHPVVPTPLRPARRQGASHRAVPMQSRPLRRWAAGQPPRRVDGACPQPRRLLCRAEVRAPETVPMRTVWVRIRDRPGRTSSFRRRARSAWWRHQSMHRLRAAAVRSWDSATAVGRPHPARPGIRNRDNWRTCRLFNHAAGCAPDVIADSVDSHPVLAGFDLQRIEPARIAREQFVFLTLQNARQRDPAA